MRSIKVFILSIIIMILLCALFLHIPTVGATSPTWTMASILRGEAPIGCLQAREMTACAIIRDYRNGVNLQSRWYGWRNAGPEDITLIERAMNTNLCASYPVCRFVGNRNDVRIWRAKGWLHGYVTTEYCNENGCSVCVHKDGPTQTMPAQEGADVAQSVGVTKSAR